mmetsp:Transcript_94953/g.142251  ORF Transcript_94953/g.142251 Transcript_94953/m.142251 type:complete len:301 (+) Transcript_94953:331-1233(+)
MSHEMMALLLPPRRVARRAPFALSQTLTVESTLPVATRSFPEASYRTHGASALWADTTCFGVVGITTLPSPHFRSVLSAFARFPATFEVEEEPSPNQDFLFSSCDFNVRSMSASVFSRSTISVNLFISLDIFSFSETNLDSSSRFSFFIKSFSSCKTLMVSFSPTYCCSANLVRDLASSNSFERCSMPRSFLLASSSSFAIVDSCVRFKSLTFANSWAVSKALAFFSACRFISSFNSSCSFSSFSRSRTSFFKAADWTPRPLTGPPALSSFSCCTTSSRSRFSHFACKASIWFKRVVLAS